MIEDFQISKKKKPVKIAKKVFGYLFWFNCNYFLINKELNGRLKDANEEQKMFVAH